MLVFKSQLSHFSHREKNYNPGPASIHCSQYFLVSYSYNKTCEPFFPAVDIETKVEVSTDDLLIPVSDSTGITLRSSDVFYTSPQELAAWQDVKLLSADRCQFTMNKSVFVAHCRMLRSAVLLRDSREDEVVISTELASDVLGEMIQFFHTGLLSAGVKREVFEEAFRSFGIDLNKLRLSEVTVADAAERSKGTDKCQVIA